MFAAERNGLGSVTNEQLTGKSCRENYKKRISNQVFGLSVRSDSK